MPPADRAYESDILRAALTERGAWANILPMPNRIKTFPVSHHLYRQRNAVERFFSKLKHFRAVATRYDKRVARRGVAAPPKSYVFPPHSCAGSRGTSI